MKVSWDYYSQYTENKKCSKPPTRSSSFCELSVILSSINDPFVRGSLKLILSRCSKQKIVTTSQLENIERRWDKTGHLFCLHTTMHVYIYISRYKYAYKYIYIHKIYICKPCQQVAVERHNSMATPTHYP